MKAADIKLELVKKIDELNSSQLKELYGLFQNYINGQDSIEEWATLPPVQKVKIQVGIHQAKAGLGKPADEVSAALRTKYGLHG